MGNKIVDVKFNNEQSIKYGYIYFDIVFSNGQSQKFHHHKSGPKLTKEMIVGKTLEELREIYKTEFDKLVNDTITEELESARL